MVYTIIYAAYVCVCSWSQHAWPCSCTHSLAAAPSPPLSLTLTHPHSPTPTPPNNRSVEGIPSARDLVADWLVNCVSRYTANMYERQGVIIPDDFATDDVLVDLDAFPQVDMKYIID